MSVARRYLAARLFLVVMLIAVGLATLSPANFPANALGPTCPEGIDVTEMGDRQPVLLVHGFLSDSGTWGPSGTPAQNEQLNGDEDSFFRRALESIVTETGSGTFVEALDYRDVSAEWVQHPDIAPRLAQAIDCMYEASIAENADAGGPGKVILIGHSMGGLAIRCALSAECNGYGAIADKVGMVYTLGAPHLGSFWRGAGGDALTKTTSFAETTLGHALVVGLCGEEDPLGSDSAVCSTAPKLLRSHAGIGFTAGSDELKALPPYPVGIPVRSTAGRILIPNAIFRAKYLTNVGDGVVALDSALSGSTSDVLGGTYVVSCGMKVAVNECLHTNLTSSDRLIQDVVGTVTTYLTTSEARAEAAARRDERKQSERGVLPAPTGPTLPVPDWNYPFTLRAIYMDTSPEGDSGQPAPAGQLYMYLAVQVRGLSTDRGAQAPPVSLFDVSWPDPACESYAGPYGCSVVLMEFYTDYMPSDTEAEDVPPPPDFESDVIIPVGEGYDVVVRGLVPDDADLSKARLKFGIASWGPDRRDWISLGGVLNRG